MKQEMLAWRNKSRSSMSSLRDEIMKSTDGTQSTVEKAKVDERKKAEAEMSKAKKEMDAFKDMIRAAAAKKEQDKK
jgi:hypothetical protein